MSAAISCVRGNRLGARRAVIMLAASLAALVLATTHVAQAQVAVGYAPWCANMGDFGFELECFYYSREQCMARASGVTNSCTANPWYVPDRRKVRRHRGGRP